MPKYNTKRENQIILLMNFDGKKWRYVATKNFLVENMLGTFVA